MRINFFLWTFCCDTALIVGQSWRNPHIFIFCILDNLFLSFFISISIDETRFISKLCVSHVAISFVFFLFSLWDLDGTLYSFFFCRLICKFWLHRSWSLLISNNTPYLWNLNVFLLIHLLISSCLKKASV